MCGIVRLYIRRADGDVCVAENNGAGVHELCDEKFGVGSNGEGRGRVILDGHGQAVQGACTGQVPHSFPAGRVGVWSVVGGQWPVVSD